MGLAEIRPVKIGSDQATSPKMGGAEISVAEITLCQDGVFKENVAQVSNEVRRLRCLPGIPGRCSKLEKIKVLLICHTIVFLSGLFIQPICSV